MNTRNMQYKLASILFADIEGYSRLMHEDENTTIAAWHDARTDIIKPTIEEFSGRIVKHTGDGFLAEFQTVSDSVSCAVAMQSKLNQHQNYLKFRMGINFGEIAVDEDDIHGDGVNNHLNLAKLVKLAKAINYNLANKVNIISDTNLANKTAPVGMIC